MNERFLSERFCRHCNKMGFNWSIGRHNWRRMTFELAVKIAGGPCDYRFYSN